MPFVSRRSASRFRRRRRRLAKLGRLGPELCGHPRGVFVGLCDGPARGTHAGGLAAFGRVNASACLPVVTARARVAVCERLRVALHAFDRAGADRLHDPSLDRSSGCRVHAVECVEVGGGLQVLRGSMFSKRRRKLARTFPVWNLARFLRFPFSALETESTRKRAAFRVSAGGARRLQGGGGWCCGLIPSSVGRRWAAGNCLQLGAARAVCCRSAAVEVGGGRGRRGGRFRDRVSAARLLRAAVSYHCTGF